MNKTPQELIDDLKAGTINAVIMGPRWRNVRLIAGMGGGIDAVIKGRRGAVTDIEAMQFVEYARGAGMTVTIE